MRGLLLNYQFGMWDAVLQKVKTNTRRIGSLDIINTNPDDFKFKGFLIQQKTIHAEFTHIPTGTIKKALLRYKPDDYAYLQEPVLHHYTSVFYLYNDHNGSSEGIVFAPLIERAKQEGAQWQNKYFMPEQHARYFVRFTGYKVERLHDISHMDCLSEGIKKQGDSYYYTKEGVKVFFPTAKKAYFSLYNEINKGVKGPENPWVFSYYFVLCPKPVL